MTAVAAQRRFIRRGIARFVYLKTVANPAVGPTRTELEAGVDFTSWIAAINGFQATPTSVPTPDMGTTFDSSIPGNLTVADSSIRVYDDLDVEEVESTFPEGDTGFVFIMRKGDKPASNSGDLFPVEISNVAPNYTVDMSPADLTIGFNITGEPQRGLAIPAAAGGM